MSDDVGLVGRRLNDDQEQKHRLTVADIFDLVAKGKLSAEDAALKLEQVRNDRNGVLKRFAAFAGHRSS